MRKINWIVLHCTATPLNTSPESIKKYWATPKPNGAGFGSTPGYHHLITPDGVIHNLQPIHLIAYGVAGFNKSSIHISTVGGIDEKGRALDNRTCEQKEAQIALLNQYSKDYPDAIIQGHRDFSPDKNRDGIISADEWMKTCPSYSVAGWLSEINFKSRAAEVIMETTATVNIREGAGVAFKTVRNPLPKGTRVKRIGKTADWVYVSLEKGVKGWVSSQYLKQIS